ncbi:hypothetical protein DM01DRAFT_1333377 [Hesseltinella vesiculosa]|uniref:UBX domain-containing protein n=1 Tax=Hesseltinella vesiculosa TaxID=101127 RepID=A0A1X2GPZ9_9FUNG|nr:hypothetical protein DM01DRAFT_1333377 [Hesseltinella vesiculosa]
MSDSSVESFMQITGASDKVARDYLQVADQNVQAAISLYLENDGNSLTSSAPFSTDAPTSSSSPAGSLAMDQDASHDTDGDSPMLSDEALARQLQEQEDGRRRRTTETDEVRAPIAPRTDILAGGPGDFDFTSVVPPAHLWAGGRRQRQQVPNALPSIFNQGDSSMMVASPDLSTPSPLASGSGSPTDSPATSSNKAKRLADLFRPPFDIMYRGSFEDARSKARSESKWLLVNIQDPTEFACQILNRDLWSESFIKDIIRESFLFLQYGNTTPDGQRFTNLYSVKNYPHIAIIDATTGESVKTWDKPLSPTDFMLEVTEFMEQKTPGVPRSSANKKPKPNVMEMSEEEQLNAAISASLQGDSHQPSSTATLTPSQPPELKETVEEESEDDSPAYGSTNILDTILPVNRPETTDMANSTRIQFRLADGSRVIRRFLKTDPVRYLFEFIRNRVPETQGKPFELVFNRQQLIDILDQEIQQAGLQNAAVIVQFS